MGKSSHPRYTIWSHTYFLKCFSYDSFLEGLTLLDLTTNAEPISGSETILFLSQQNLLSLNQEAKSPLS